MSGQIILKTNFGQFCQKLRFKYTRHVSTTGGHKWEPRKGGNKWGKCSSDDGPELKMYHDKSSIRPSQELIVGSGGQTIGQQSCYLGALNVISPVGSRGPDGAVSLTALAHWHPCVFTYSCTHTHIRAQVATHGTVNIDRWEIKEAERCCQFVKLELPISTHNCCATGTRNSN